MFSNRIACAFSAALLAGACHAPVQATLILSDSASSAKGPGSFTGIVDYVAQSHSQGVLSISLTNTSDPTKGGFVTGFVFNIDSDDANAAAVLDIASHPFIGLAHHAAPPFGMSFSAGAALGGHWSGGGNPNPGIGVGQTGSFIFNIYASDAMELSPQSFVTGPAAHNFVVRFRGFDDGGSGQVAAVIPGPATLALLAVVVLVHGRRRRPMEDDAA